ncbi:MAG TPA: hypothetical protein PKY82_19435 [Pyrinomonadaceae bacterium]|nr:hypothetical protein [Pyrinomonadaceae bacterium]
MNFYNCLIEWSEGKDSNLRNFWVWAKDLGEAIEKVCKCADKLDIKNPIPRYFDFFDFDELPEEVFSIDEEETFVADEFHIFPIEDCYKIPTGVILSFEECEFEDTQIKLGYDVIDYDSGLIEVEAVVKEDDILRIYLDLITVLPEIRVVMVKLQEDWEAKNNEEIFINEQIAAAELIKNFIEINKIDTLQNGHVTLTTYFDEGQTNINISDHKTLVIMSYDKKIIERVRKILKKYGLRKKKNLICLSRGFHHWHYKPHNALNRKDLIKKLKKQGFTKWKQDKTN